MPLSHSTLLPRPSNDTAAVPAVALVGLFVFTLLGHLVWYWAAAPDPGFADGDGYMRVLRVERLLETGAWFENLIPRANAPFGDTLHWTRPLDVLIVLLSAPMIPVLGVREAVFWGGSISNPLLHAAATVAIAWGAYPLVGRSAATLAAIVSIAQPTLLLYSTVNRADHHALYVFLTALGLGIMVRALDAGRASLRWAFGAGLVAAASLWIGVEALIFVALCLVGLALPWLFGGDGDGARKMHVFARGLAGGLVAAILIERGFADFLAVEYDRLSIVYVTLGALILAGVAILGEFDRRRPRAATTQRLLAGGLCGAVALAAWWSLYPNILRNPTRVIDPEIGALLPRIIQETGSGLTPERFTAFLGGTILALAYLAWRRRSFWSAPTRWTWVFIALCVVVYGVLSAVWLRWNVYAGIFPCVILGDMIRCVVERVQSSGAPRFRREAFAALVVFSVIVGPMAATAGTAYLFGGLGADTKARRQKCRAASLADVLNRSPWSDRPRIVLTGVDYGPELLYRTRHGIVGTLYHRNIAGIGDTLRAFTAKDDTVARSIINRRGIDLVAICPAVGNDGLVRASTESSAFYQRLATDAAPAWLREVSLPREASAFRLFEVLPEGG